MSMNEIRPFLKRDTRPTREIRPSTDYVQAEIDRYKALCTREKLRYKWRYLHAIDLHWRAMQRLGDFGRKYFPWIGSGGWNGIGGGGGGR